jgi:hypothetical protein
MVFPRWLQIVFVLVSAVALPSAAMAADYYVDSRIGDNLNDGKSPDTVDVTTGPVKTIRRGLERVGPGDTLHIANHGVPYTESLQIVGSRFRGGFTIEGNGAVVTGAKPVPFQAWQPLGDGLWRFRPHRKAFYQLVTNGHAVREMNVMPGAKSPPALGEGTWCAWHGMIYYRLYTTAGSQSVDPDAPLEFAAEEVGITLLDVDDVLIRNLELRHFRLDGVNVHDRCQNIILDHVKLTENGRAGLAVGGSSLVGIKDSEVAGNRVTQILSTEVAQTELLNTQIGSGVGAAITRKGGHVLVDDVDQKD